MDGALARQPHKEGGAARRCGCERACRVWIWGGDIILKRERASVSLKCAVSNGWLSRAELKQLSTASQDAGRVVLTLPEPIEQRRSRDPLEYFDLAWCEPEPEPKTMRPETLWL